VTRLSKRVFDIVISLGALPIAAPAMLVAALMVRLKDGSPVLYRSRRVGADGRPFTLLKIRTMMRDAHRASLGSVTVAEDPRATATGRALRRWKIDELPQLINVLLGDMSLVGPRPEDPEFVAMYSEEQRKILRYTPGMTSPASIRFVNESELLGQAEDPRRKYLDEIMPEEIRIDLEYFRRATLFSDLGVLARTLSAVLYRR
jgi:lipopolysaccharide/colanic/teichoic acid biosynthesis glycosyltransferase